MIEKDSKATDKNQWFFYLSEERRNMLTQKQEQFCQNIVKGMSQSDAYRDAYPGTKMSDKSIWEKSCTLAKSVKVKARIKELRDMQAVSKIMTAQERLEWLTKIIKSKKETTTDKLRASDQMNKMQGEYVQKVIGTMDAKLEDLI